MPEKHSADWLRGAVESLNRAQRDFTVTVPELQAEYVELLAEAEAREAGDGVMKIMDAVWYTNEAREASVQGVADCGWEGHDGMSPYYDPEAPHSGCPWCGGTGKVLVVKASEASVPTAAEVKAQIIAEYIDMNSTTCDCCQHVMIDVTATEKGGRSHCVAGDPEGEGSGCAWGMHQDASQRPTATEVIAECRKAFHRIYWDHEEAEDMEREAKEMIAKIAAWEVAQREA
jgi:hypothetical protein